MTPRRAGCRAFTLMEVLIAIALVLLLLGAMFGFLFDMLDSRSRALEHARQHQAAAVLIKALEDDLLTCVAAHPAGGAGVRGDATSIRVLCRGVAANLASKGLGQPALFSDLQRSEFRFNSDLHQVEGRRSAGFGREPPQQDVFTPIQGVVHGLRFRYHDGVQWRETFDSLEERRLPMAVEIAMWLRPTAAMSAPGAGQRADDVAEEFGDPGPNAEDPAPPDRLRVIAIPDWKPQAFMENAGASDQP